MLVSPRTSLSTGVLVAEVFYLFMIKRSCFIQSLCSMFASIAAVMCKWWRFKVLRGRRVVVCEQIAVDVVESGQTGTKT